jgi:putative flippase GtrA
VRFYTLAVVNYLISVAWIQGFHSWLGINYLVARTANIALAVGWNFLLYKHWVYRVEESGSMNQESGK